MDHQTEPSAAIRSFAAHLWQTFVALTSEGFSERQAMMLLGEMMTNAALMEDGGENG
jgi:Trp operon repressor